MLDPLTHISSSGKFFSAKGPNSKYLRLRRSRNKIEAIVYGSLHNERKNFPQMFDDIKNAYTLDAECCIHQKNK